MNIAKRLKEGVLSRLLQRAIIIPPYNDWAEDLSDVLTRLKTIKIKYAQYFCLNSSDDEILAKISEVEDCLTELLVIFGKANKELQSETVE